MSKLETGETTVEEGGDFEGEIENEDEVMAWDEDEQDDLKLDEAKDVPEILKLFVSRFRSRSSDIFADFGANALFMIDGEALLGHCFENHLVDWQYGGEPLHILYLFLFYLQHLSERDARFRVAFFENCEPLWCESKKLTRFLVINHLKEFTKYDVDMLPSISSPEFTNYLVQYFPTNIMTKLLWEGVDGNSGEATLQSVCRTLCMQSLVGGRSVFLLEEGITFRGPRVYMFVMFYRSKSNKAMKFLEQTLDFLPSPASSAPSDELKGAYNKVLNSWKEGGEKLKEVGQRLAIGWGCLAEGVKKGMEGLKGEMGVFLGKVFFLHLVMLHFRGPLKRGFLLPEERPKNSVFDGGMQLLNDMYPLMLEFAKDSVPEKVSGKIVNTESDLWDGRAFFALVLALFKVGGGKEVAVEKILGVLGLKKENSEDLVALISSFDKSGALGAPFFPLSFPASAKGEVEALEKIFDSLVKKNEEITKNNEEKAKFTLSWTDTPEILSDCVPEVCDILDKKDHKYIPPDEKPPVDAWEVGSHIQDPDHYSYSIGVKVSATVSEEAYKALVGLSVALAKARDIGNDEVARIAREAALMMFQVNRSISDEMGICANKRNWLDLQKIVSKHIKQLDPKRLNQKQGDFFSKYAESLIGGPICRQSIREVEPETKNVKKEEKVAKPHQVKGKAKVVLAKKHLQQLDRCLATLQDLDAKKLGVIYDKVDYIVKQGSSNTSNSANVRLSWDSFQQSFKDIKELRGKVSSTMDSVNEVRDLSAKQKGPMQQKTTTLQKIDALHIEDKLVGLQWYIRVQRMQNISLPWWETFVRKRKAKNGAKNEEWAASVVLDQLMGDVMAVKAYLATNPPAPAEFEASSGASGSKGKTSKIVRGKPGRELKNSDSSPLASMCVQAAMRFGFEDLAKQIGKDLKYKISSKDKQYPDVARKGSFVEFQLCCMGPRLPRPVGKPDDRTTGFNPDDWQRDLLDIVDRKESALISAPTSSGKTFISFYAMEQVLREPSHGSDLPVIVYVSPTKALVNQVQAEVAARFVKNYQFPGQTICGVFTKDFRYNVESCQILVTVPDCLDVMLLSPQYASWIKRIRWVIFDEVHMISKEGGEVWERLILYLDCPFLALSATVGNPTEFEEWLRKVGEAKTKTRLPGKGKEVEGDNKSQFHLIKHEQRWNDLEIGWVKSTPVEGSITPSYDVLPINPLGTLDILSTRRDGFPSIKLLPEQSLDAAKKLAEVLEGKGGDFEERAKALIPNNYFSLEEELRIRLNQVVEFEKALLALIRDVIMDAPEVGQALVSHYAEQNGFKSLDNSDVASLSARSLLDFLWTLQNKEEDEMEGLPVIVFNLDDNKCKNLANQIEEFLACEQFNWEILDFIKRHKDSKSEAAQAGTLSTSELCKDVGANEQAYWNFICRYPSIASGSIPATLEDKPEADQHKKKVLEALHKSKLRYYDKQISLAAKLSKVKAKKKEKAADNKPDEGDIPDDEDEVSPEASVEQFQPGYINPRFSFCGKDGAVTDAVLREHSLLRLPENLLRFLRRGIGIHFMDLPIKYKNAVERLFRSRHLSVIIATETLSLGINMPCRTVLFHGDHAKLDAQMFRQMSGRAGRRNFDLRGKVLFYGTPKPKIKMMLNSRLGQLTGNVPLTPSLSLRLFHRHFQAKGKNKEIAHETASAISRVLHLPFSVIRKGAGDFTIPVQFLFCFEYYLRNRVIEHKEKKVAIKVEEPESDSDEELDWEGLDDEEEEEMGVSTELVPSALSGFMSRLFYLEPNNLYLVSLLRSGVLVRLCKQHKDNEEELCAALMEILAHLWGVIPVSQLQDLPPSKNELVSVTLPPLKGKFRELMNQHNSMAMDIFTAYVHFCAGKKGAEQDVEKLMSLPGSSASLFASGEGAEEGVMEGLMVKSQTRSPFAMLSGHGDVYERAEDFVTSVRPGFEVDSSLMPTMNEEIGNRKLSAYALDFFRNGRVDILENHCKISRSNAYALLKEFSSSLLGVSLALQRRADIEGTGKADRELLANSFKILNGSFETKFKKAYEKW